MEAKRLRAAVGVEEIPMVVGDDPSEERATVQSDLKSAEVALAAIQRLPSSEDLAPVVQARQERVDALRKQLRDLKPLRSQLRAAEENRDRVKRKAAQLEEEIGSLETNLLDKSSNTPSSQTSFSL